MRRLSLANLVPAQPATDQYDPLGIGQAPPRRRGFFGGPARGIIRREDGDPGTLLNYALFGRGGVSGMRQDAMTRDIFNMRKGQAEREIAQEEEDRANLESAIGSLPENMQPWARIAPNQVAQGMFARSSDRYGDLESIDGRLGQRNMVTGQYDWAPQVPTQMRPPQGYRYTEGGDLEAIPGGPADIRAGESAQRMRRFYDTAIRNRENVLESIENARRQANDFGATGVWAQMFSGLGGTNAHDLQSEVDTIIANIGFEALQEMRANSQTGGALGQVAVRELEMLQATIANLRTSQSREQFQRNLTRVEEQYRRTLAAYEAARSELDRGSSPERAAPTNSGGESSQPRILRWNPSTGQLE